MSDSPVPRRLHAARMQAGLSQRALGINAGIDEFSASPRINQYERGRHAPDYLTLSRLAAVLDVPTAYFYAESDDLAGLVLAYHRAGLEKRHAILKAAT